jgi:NADPH:quinone reductase-like Zn-dependent oxidoreductase
MKAIVLSEFGGPEKLQLREVPDPTAGTGELAVRVTAASINPVDWKLRSGAIQKYMPLQLPAVLGRDVSGTVLAVGKGVTGFSVGDRVLGLVNGGYAEMVVARAEAWALVPRGLDLADAAALPLVSLTGAQLAEVAVAARAGETILVTGATGGVGRAAVFAARAAGARVLAGVRSAHREAAAGLGADAVVALDVDADIERLPALDAIADTVGGPTVQKLLGKVKPGGRIGSVVGETPGARDRGLSVKPLMTHPDPARLAQLAEAASERRLVIPIARRFPLAEAAEAQRVAEGGAAGKVLLLV